MFVSVKHKLSVQTFVSIPPHPLLPLVPSFVYFFCVFLGPLEIHIFSVFAAKVTPVSKESS